MPVGLLYQLFHAAEHRGRDSSGVAYWDSDLEQNFIVKHAVTASLFTKVNSNYVNSAQRSARGIAHTRRASPRMPVDNENAHPFMYGSYVFAHNGSIKNWQVLKKDIIDQLGKSSANDAATKLEFISKANTDSMILGPAIEARNFKDVVGCMGLAWLYGEKLYAFRSKKELTSANITWNISGDRVVHQLTVVASTWEIIEESLAKLQNIRYDAVEGIMHENRVYEINPGSSVDTGLVAVSSHNSADSFTSKTDPA